MAYPSPSAKRPRILTGENPSNIYTCDTKLLHTPSAHPKMVVAWRKENPCSIHLPLPFRILTSVHACFSLRKNIESVFQNGSFKPNVKKTIHHVPLNFLGVLWMGPVLARNSWTLAKLTSWSFLGNLSWWNDLLSKKQSIITWPYYPLRI